MKLNEAILALVFILTSQIFAVAQEFDLSAFLEATQAVARKTGYQGWIEYVSDFKVTEIMPNGKKNSYTYENICSRKTCTSIQVAKNDRRFSEKKIEKYRKQAAKIFIKAENRPDARDYGEKENENGYGISVFDWFAPNLYLKICKSELAEKSSVNGRATLKIKVGECNLETITNPKFKDRVEFMTKTDGFIWIDEQDKAIIKMEIYAKKEFPNLSKTDQPLVVIEADKIGEGYWFWKNAKFKALDNKAVFPKFKMDVEYEFFNYRLSNAEVKSAEIDKQ